jgi:cytochrome b561
MQLRNTSTRYGWVSIVIHWSVALVVFGLFALGLWMVGLDYYSLWRKDAPDLHKSIGITLFAVMLVRVVWRWISPAPPALASYSRMTRIGAASGHGFLYRRLVCRDDCRLPDFHRRRRRHPGVWPV